MTDKGEPGADWLSARIGEDPPDAILDAEADRPSQEKHQRRPPGGGLWLSELVRQIADEAPERMRLGDLIRAFGDHVFGALLVVFALPNVAPLPPGSSTVFAIPLLLVSAQMALGRKSLWAPGALCNRTISRDTLTRIAAYSAPVLQRVERLLHPRFEAFVNDRLIGIVAFVLAVVLVLPIPLGNLPPAVALTALGLGLLYGDGLAVLAGYLAATASLVIVTLVSGAMILAAKYAWMASGLGG
jgi:hypothetical protein